METEGEAEGESRLELSIGVAVKLNSWLFPLCLREGGGGMHERWIAVNEYLIRLTLKLKLMIIKIVKS